MFRKYRFRYNGILENDDEILDNGMTWHELYQSEDGKICEAWEEEVNLIRGTDDAVLVYFEDGNDLYATIDELEEI